MSQKANSVGYFCYLLFKIQNEALTQYCSINVNRMGGIYQWLTFETMQTAIYSEQEWLMVFF